MLYIQYLEDRYMTHIKKKQVFRSAYLGCNPFSPFILAQLQFCPLSICPICHHPSQELCGNNVCTAHSCILKYRWMLSKIPGGTVTGALWLPTGRGLCSDLAFLTCHSCSHISRCRTLCPASLFVDNCPGTMPGWTPAKLIEIGAVNGVELVISDDKAAGN